MRAGVLAAAIAGPQQSFVRQTPLHRHRQRIHDQAALHVFVHRPADDPPRVQVLDGGQLQPAFTRLRVHQSWESPVLATAPLSWLSLTPEEMAERDLYVVTQVRERSIPLAMVLSGGYGPASWEAHARSIEGILARFDSQT